MKPRILSQGAEAKIELNKNIIIKNRIQKSYRLKELDEKIRKLRTRSEAKLLEKAGKIIPTPNIIKVNEKNKKIEMEFLDGKKLSQELDNFSLEKQKQILKQAGINTAKIHKEGIIHGDLTTSNMILVENKLYFIDFGLGFSNGKIEDKAVDLHLIKEALEAKHFEHWKELFESFQKSYASINKEESKKVLERLKAVEKRGRYRH